MYNKFMDYFYRAKKFRTKKRLGQNFLIDEGVIDEILNNVDPKDDVLEIGPGIGFVTERLVESANSVLAVEIDKDAIEVLNKNLSSKANFKLVEKDILKFNLDEYFKHDQKIKVVANIPYYITSPILVHLLGEIDDFNNKNRAKIKEIILMVQLEVAKRLVANENSENKEYGMLTILTQFNSDVEIIRKVSKRCFWPAPKVDSALVRLKIKDTPRVLNHSPLLKRTVKAIFNSRRKNIKNSLLNAGFINVEPCLLKIGMDLNLRGEKLSIEKINELAHALEEFNLNENNKGKNTGKN